MTNLFKLERVGVGEVYESLKVKITHNYNADSDKFGDILKGKVKGYCSKTALVKEKDTLRNDDAKYKVLAVRKGLRYKVLILERLS